MTIKKTNALKITISGRPKAGKSGVAASITAFLRDLGADVSCDDDDGYLGQRTLAQSRRIAGQVPCIDIVVKTTRRPAANG
jgi:hypothetical protein